LFLDAAATFIPNVCRPIMCLCVCLFKF
jgi:hypothetical protein